MNSSPACSTHQISEHSPASIVVIQKGVIIFSILPAGAKRIPLGQAGVT